MVQALLETQGGLVALDHPATDNDTPLYAAAAAGHTEAVKVGATS